MRTLSWLSVIAIKTDEFNACPTVPCLKRLLDYLWKSARHVYSGPSKPSQTPFDRTTERVSSSTLGGKQAARVIWLLPQYLLNPHGTLVKIGLWADRLALSNIYLLVCVKGSSFRFSRIHQLIRWWGGERKFWSWHLKLP